MFTIPDVYVLFSLSDVFKKGSLMNTEEVETESEKQ